MIGLLLVFSSCRVRKFNEEGKCDFCKNIVMLVKDYLEEGKTQEEISQFLQEKVCPIFPESYEKICTTIAKTMIPEIIKSIADKMNPDLICQKIKMCHKTFPRRSGIKNDSSNTCSSCIRYINRGYLYMANHCGGVYTLDGFKQYCETQRTTPDYAACLWFIKDRPQYSEYIAEQLSQGNNDFEQICVHIYQCKD